MASATPVTDHEEIRQWVESRGGRPACVKGTAALLRVDFGEPDEKLQPIDWDQWFETFDSRNLAALLQEGGRSRFIKLVSRESAGTRGGSTRDAAGRGRTRRTLAKRAGAKSAAKGAGRKAGASARAAADASGSTSGARRKRAGATKAAGGQKRGRKGGRKSSAGGAARKTSARAGAKGGASRSATRSTTGGSVRKGSRRKTSGRGGGGR